MSKFIMPIVICVAAVLIWLVKKGTYYLATKGIKEAIGNKPIRLVCHYCTYFYGLITVVCAGMVTMVIVLNVGQIVPKEYHIAFIVLGVMFVLIMAFSLYMMVYRIYVLTDSEIWVRGITFKWKHCKKSALKEVQSVNGRRSYKKYYFENGSFIVGGYAANEYDFFVKVSGRSYYV